MGDFSGSVSPMSRKLGQSIFIPMKGGLRRHLHRSRDCERGIGALRVGRREAIRIVRDRRRYRDSGGIVMRERAGEAVLLAVAFDVQVVGPEAETDILVVLTTADDIWLSTYRTPWSQSTSFGMPS